MEKDLKKLDPLHVRSFEEEVALIQEGEKNYIENGAISIEEIYNKTLVHLNSLKR